MCVPIDVQWNLLAHMHCLKCWLVCALVYIQKMMDEICSDHHIFEIVDRTIKAVKSYTLHVTTIY